MAAWRRQRGAWGSCRFVVGPGEGILLRWRGEAFGPKKEKGVGGITGLGVLVTPAVSGEECGQITVRHSLSICRMRSVYSHC